MDQADIIALAAPLAEIGALLALFVKMHTAPQFAELQAAVAALRDDVAALREGGSVEHGRLDQLDDKTTAALASLRSEVGEIVTKAHDRINPMERDIARLEERTK